MSIWFQQRFCASRLSFGDYGQPAVLACGNIRLEGKPRYFSLISQRLCLIINKDACHIDTHEFYPVAIGSFFGKVNTATRITSAAAARMRNSASTPQLLWTKAIMGRDAASTVRLMI